MGSASRNLLNPNAPPYLPLPPPPPVKIWTPQYYSNCHVISYFYPQPQELIPVYFGDGAKARVSMRSRTSCKYSGDVTRVKDGGSESKTVMIRNIPNQFRQIITSSRQMMLEFLDQLCVEHNMEPSPAFRCEYDFVYLPVDFRSGHNLGYAFVNLTSSSGAQWIKKTLCGYKWGGLKDGQGSCFQSKKICHVTRARIQGKDNLINHFQNSIFNCYTAEYLPVILTPPRDGTTNFSSPMVTGRHIGSQ